MAYFRIRRNSRERCVSLLLFYFQAFQLARSTECCSKAIANLRGFNCVVQTRDRLLSTFSAMSSGEHGFWKKSHWNLCIADMRRCHKSSAEMLQRLNLQTCVKMLQRLLPFMILHDLTIEATVDRIVDPTIVPL